MSHIVTIDVKVFDLAALKAACARLELTEPVQETVQLFPSKATGYCVRLPNWRYPVVFNLTSGEAQYDNFNGRWGEQAELHKLMQSYTCEKTKTESRKQGHTVTEQLLSDGSIKLTIQVGVPRETHRNHHHTGWPDPRRDEGFCWERVPGSQPDSRTHPRPIHNGATDF